MAGFPIEVNLSHAFNEATSALSTLSSEGNATTKEEHQKLAEEVRAKHRKHKRGG